jgi:hypothetical protein
VTILCVSTLGNGLVMRPGVMLALIISQIFLPRVPFNIICILCNFITHPEISHFHRLQVPSLNSVVHDTDSGCIVAIDLYFWLGVSQFFQCQAEIMPSLKLKNRTPSSASAVDVTTNQSMTHKVKKAPFIFMGLLFFADNP